MSTHNKAERVARIQGGLKVKTDCFAYNKKKRECDALSELICMNRKCSFYKHKEGVGK